MCVCWRDFTEFAFVRANNLLLFFSRGVNFGRQEKKKTLQKLMSSIYLEVGAPAAADFIVRYWKLLRVSNFRISPKRILVSAFLVGC